MKDINKEERSDFERGWQKAFENAEEMPVNDLWTAIDAQLANQDTRKYKRKMLFYKWVAAASVLFAIGLSYFSYTTSTSKTFLFAAHTLMENGMGNDGQIEDNATSESYSSNHNEKIDETRLYSIKDPAEIQPGRKYNDQNPIAYTEGKMPNSRGKSTTGETEFGNSDGGHRMDNILETSGTSDQGVRGAVKKTYANAIAENKAMPGEEEDPNIKKVLTAVSLKRAEARAFDLQHYAQLLDPPHLYAIPGVMIHEEQNTEHDRRSLWAGINFGSSIFDPNFHQGSNFQPKSSPALSQTFAKEAPQTATLKENTEAGISYSFGLNFGMRLSEKWVIQSGVRYAHKSASTSSATYLKNNFNTAKAPAFKADTESAVVNTAERSFSQEYDLLNSFEFASIPLKAGYLILDKKIGLMLTAGIGADLFLSNTISETNDKLEEVTVAAGSSSPFREVNFNGLLGAEIFYEISNQYHLTLEPNYSIALKPFTKSGAEFKSNPQTFGLTAGLKFYWK